MQNLHMELLDLLETRVVELLGQMNSLREQNRTLQEQNTALNAENQNLKESLDRELHIREEVNGRINTVLSTIHEFTGEA